MVWKAAYPGREKDFRMMNGLQDNLSNYKSYKSLYPLQSVVHQLRNANGAL